MGNRLLRPGTFFIGPVFSSAGRVCRWSVLLLFLPVLWGMPLYEAVGQTAGSQVSVHAVTDLSHEFTFYADNRFYQQYLPQGKGVVHWASLTSCDLTNANLLILPGCFPQLSYTDKEIHFVREFLMDGGGVLLLGDARNSSQNSLLEAFGARFEPDAAYPLSAVRGIALDTLRSGTLSYLHLHKKRQWTVMVSDAEQRPVMAQKQIGKGKLLVASRNLAGRNPNASDSIHASMWRALLPQLASGKRIDPEAPLHALGMNRVDYAESSNGLTLRFNENLKPFADEVFALTHQTLPFVEFRMGVPLSEGMATDFLLLPTDGGGFSSGKMVALAAWWDGFPTNRPSMIELIVHEAVHSWVLPLPEVWNEPIATYVGNLVMIDMGYREEGERRIARQIARATRHDPEMNRYDLDGKTLDGSAPLTGSAINDMHWGKTFWILEQLRKEKPDLLSRYFRAKREMTAKNRITRTDMHNTVSLLSLAMGRDLFGWFRERGFDVSRERAQVRF
ncbi:MAG: hypothetical protein AB7C90_02140 [Bacteroidales bacterium]